MEASLEEAEQRDGELQFPDFGYKSQQISSLDQANCQWISAICNRNDADSQVSQSSVLGQIGTRRAGLQPWACCWLSLHPAPILDSTSWVYIWDSFLQSLYPSSVHTYSTLNSCLFHHLLGLKVCMLEAVWIY